MNNCYSIKKRSTWEIKRFAGKNETFPAYPNKKDRLGEYA